MRIVLAHKYFYRGGGTATYLLQLIPELERRGHECIPFTVAFEKAIPSPYSRYYVSPLSDPSQTHLKDLRMTPLVMAKLFGRTTWSTEAYRKALGLCDETQPDVAYVHNLYTYMSPSPIAAFKKKSLPVVMRVSDAAMMCPGLRGWRNGAVCISCARFPLKAFGKRCHKGSSLSTMARSLSMQLHLWMRVYDRVDAFVTPSRFMADLLRQSGLTHKPLVCIPSFWPATPPSPEHREGDYVLYFGRVSREKGLETLIRAFASLGGCPRLQIVGADVDGYTEELRQLAAQLAPGRVEFSGHQSREALDEIIAGCLFVVVPSEWAENSPMSVLEAFGHGKPVVGSDVGGIPELVTPDVGLLYPPGSVEALSAAMNLLLTDSQRRRDMGRAARERLTHQYSAENHCQSLLALFRQLRGETEQCAAQSACQSPNTAAGVARRL